MLVLTTTSTLSYVPPDNQQPEILRLAECEANTSAPVWSLSGSNCIVGDEDESAAASDASMPSSTSSRAPRSRGSARRIAIIISGLAVKVESPPLSLSFEANVLTPLTAAGHVLSVYCCLGHLDMTSPFARAAANWSVTQRLLFSRDATAKDRLATCYAMAAADHKHHKDKPYDVFMRTRPDLYWFAPLRLPPLSQLSKHVALRARLLLAPRPPRPQQLSWTCKNAWRVGRDDRTTCFLVDDQVALVPPQHADAYFTPDGCVGAHDHAARHTECSHPYWSRPTELVASMRLAVCNVSVLVHDIGATLLTGKGSMATVQGVLKHNVACNRECAVGPPCYDAHKS